MCCLPGHRIIMHYMIDPPSDEVLSPSPHVMDCELRSWAADFNKKMLFSFDYPALMIHQRVARFEMDICGHTGRKLWIMVHDEVSGRGFPEEQTDIFLEGFSREYLVPFWDVIPASDNPQRDHLERSERLGVASSPIKSATKSSQASEDDCRAVPSRSAIFAPASISLWCKNNRHHYRFFQCICQKPGIAVCVCGTPACKGYMYMCRGAQHHWHTARNDAIANGGKESGTLDSVPARTAP